MQKESDTLVPAGRLFCVADGEYSSYRYVGHFLALQPITTALFASVRQRCEDRIRNGEASYAGTITTMDSDRYLVDAAMMNFFLPELVRSGAVLEIDCTEIHLEDAVTKSAALP